MGHRRQLGSPCQQDHLPLPFLQNNKVLERQRQKVLHEIGIFRTIEDHPNTVKVLEVFEGAECYYIVMECCEGGELFDHISKMKVRFLGLS